jgi:hypothetical protein
MHVSSVERKSGLRMRASARSAELKSKHELEYLELIQLAQFDKPACLNVQRVFSAKQVTIRHWARINVRMPTRRHDDGRHRWHPLNQFDHA